MSNHLHTVSGTCGGMLLSVLPYLSAEDVYRTISLAVIGAVTSFIISYILKKLLEERTRKKRRF